MSTRTPDIPWSTSRARLRCEASTEFCRPVTMRSTRTSSAAAHDGLRDRWITGHRRVRPLVSSVIPIKASLMPEHEQNRFKVFVYRIQQPKDSTTNPGEHEDLPFSHVYSPSFRNFKQTPYYGLADLTWRADAE
jgi:hypothetical protein